MDFPKVVLEIVHEEAVKYGDDITQAVTVVMRRVRKLPEFPEIMELNFQRAMKELVHTDRHQSNVYAKREAGCYGKPSKVNVGTSAAVNRVADSIYSYCIAGTTLGLLMGKQLAEIADSENAIADGHLFNVRLCRKLLRVVPEDKSVQEVVGANKLRAIFRAVQRQADKKELAVA